MTEPSKFARTMTIVNPKGLHTRPSTELVKHASRFQSQISLKYKRHTVNGKSLLSIMMLAAPCGAKIKVIAVGDDAEEAIETIVSLAEEGFDIDC